MVRTNFKLTVLPLARLNSVTSMCVPLVSPSVLATTPVVGAAEVTVAVVAVVAVGCGVGATVAVVAVVSVLTVDVGAGSFFLQPKRTTKKRMPKETIFLMSPPDSIISFPNGVGRYTG